MKGYSLGNIIRNAICLLYTKIFWKKARMVRLPILIRNKKNILYDIGFTCGSSCRMNVSCSGKLKIGKNFVMGDQCQIEAMNKVVIGDNCLLASRIYIGDASHGRYRGNVQDSPIIAPRDRIIETKPIIIGNNVWIGNGVSILGGVKIGNGVVIGANSIVTKDIPDNMIAVGNPAHLIKQYDFVKKEWIHI